MTAPGGYQPPEQVNPIQLLSVLAGIQESRRRSDLADKQFEEGKKQFAEQMGITKDSADYKKMMDALHLYGESASEARSGLHGLGEVLFPGTDPGSLKKRDLLVNYGQNAPESLQAIQQIAATRGYRGAEGTPAQGQMNTEAATVATSGMNQGAMQNSGLQALIARQGQSQVTPQMGQDAAQFAANRQSPLEALVNRTIQNNPAWSGKMAETQAGMGMTAAQQAQTDIGRGGVEAEFAKLRQDGRYQEMEIATKLLTAKQQGAFNPSDMMSAYGRLAELQKNITDPKSDEAARKQAMAAYNSLAAIMSAAGFATNLQYGPGGDGGPAGTGQKIGQFIGGVTRTPPPLDIAAPPTSNPLNPFFDKKRP